ncbi:FAD:protein FMN transferase [Cupriavidus taiwanensis]|uniref:FAD:protein FMN transferase n=1 Tax=Cupriavidus taiwanensis TaxID=164546 RepID=UPI000E124185|nr:FAD:protein FMN transferase [Cupriavidus taiwanensis]SPC20052.1 Thiamine biosynthesis lipoprotein apbE family [Cupriavidus taiwanensis]
MNRVLVPVALSAPTSPPAAGARLQRWGGPTMGTSWSVAALLPPDADAGAIGAGIRAVLGRVIAQMSNWEADSDLSRFNRAPSGSWHALPADAFAVLQAALQVARDSGGAYDPSAGPLVDLWGFGPAPARRAPPSPDDVQAARGRCGWARIEIDAAGRRAWQPGGVALDFCAIAKGFAVDAVARYLCEQGLEHHLTEIGGELRGHGVKPDGMPWWVALEAPPGAGSDDAQQTLVALHGLSVATSGDYRRYFDSDGRRYAHTIDPRTGYPASHALASVTVIHPQCMLADALSTALTVLGPDAGMAHARRHGVAARFLVRTANGFLEHLSPAFAAMLA